MRAVETFKRVLRNFASSPRLIAEIVQGIANQSSLMNEKLEALIQGSDNQSKLLNEKLHAIQRELEKMSLNLTSIAELQKAQAELEKAQLVMQRDQAEATEGLVAAIKKTLADRGER
jgi:Skp family chaperone for outer membrane proteins